MNQLNNISRDGGFPLCAETLQVLYDNATVVNRLLSNLNLAAKTAIILQEGELQDSQYTGYAYIYGSGDNRIVKYTRASTVLFSSAKMSITTASNDVSSTTATYEDAYTSETATIVTEGTSANQWKFYALNEVIEPAIFEDKLSDLTYEGTSNVTFSAAPTLSGSNNVFSRNKNRLRLKFEINLNATAIPSNGYFYFNIDSTSIDSLERVIGNNSIAALYVNSVYPVNAVMLIDGAVYRIESYIYNNRLYFKLGKMAVDNGFTASNNNYSANGTIFVNSEVLL